MAGTDHSGELPAHHLGALIRARRRELGPTHAGRAARTEKPPSYIPALESDNVAPSLTPLRHIAGALDPVVGFFFEQPGDGGRAEPAPGGRPRVVRPATRKVLIDPSRGDVRWELL